MQVGGENLEQAGGDGNSKENQKQIPKGKPKSKHTRGIGPPQKLDESSNSEKTSEEEEVQDLMIWDDDE